jgi:hypothetical protein
MFPNTKLKDIVHASGKSQIQSSKAWFMQVEQVEKSENGHCFIQMQSSDCSNWQ